MASSSSSSSSIAFSSRNVSFSNKFQSAIPAKIAAVFVSFISPFHLHFLQYIHAFRLDTHACRCGAVCIKLLIYVQFHLLITVKLFNCKWKFIVFELFRCLYLYIACVFLLHAFELELYYLSKVSRYEIRI